MIVPTSYNELQDEIAEVARGFFADHAGPRRLRGQAAAGPFDPAAWSVMGELGWLGMLATGDEFGLADAGVIASAAGAELYAGPLIETIAAAPLVRDRVDADPGAVISVAWEPEADAVTAEAPISAALSGGRLSGSFGLVPFADAADFLVVRATSGEEPVLVVVEAGTAGVHVTARPGADLAGRPCHARFVDAAVLAEIARGPQAERAALDLTTRCMALASAETVGVSVRTLEIATRYALDRRQFDRPIGSFQAVQQRLADMTTATVTAHAASDAALAAAESSTARDAQRARVAKAYTARAVRDVTEGALQVLGGIAFAEEHDMHLYLKRGLALAASWGEPELHELILGRALLERAGAAA